MSFASRLKQAREQAGLTQQAFADKLGVTKNSISNYENGVSSPKWDILLKIFDVLHVDPNFLYQDNFSPIEAASLRSAIQAVDEQEQAQISDLFSGHEKAERISFTRSSPTSSIISFRFTSPYPVIAS